MWDQKKFGHPGNWREDAVEFSLRTFVEVALRIQNASWIPGAIEFDSLYEHKITALENGVEIVEEIKSHNIFAPAQQNVVKILQKGESLRCEVSQSKMINALALILSGKKEPLTIWFYDDSKRIYGTVDADKVRVTCVPRVSDCIREFFPDLPELEYKP